MGKCWFHYFVSVHLGEGGSLPNYTDRSTSLLTKCCKWQPACFLKRVGIFPSSPSNATHLVSFNPVVHRADICLHQSFLTAPESYHTPVSGFCPVSNPSKKLSVPVDVLSHFKEQPLILRSQVERKEIWPARFSSHVEGDSIAVPKHWRDPGIWQRLISVFSHDGWHMTFAASGSYL